MLLGTNARGAWCSLNKVNLSHEHFDDLEGVYIIWHGGPTPKIVRVGQGVIRTRLTAHRQDEEIQAYAGLNLYVTWARVDASSRGGIEAFLADELSPLVGERFPDVPPIPVNLPWGA
jgi:hypothetical protein